MPYRKLIKKLYEANDLKDRPGSGRNRCTTAAQDRHITKKAQRNPLKSTSIFKEIAGFRGLHISRQTIIDKLNVINLYRRVAMDSRNCRPWF